MIRNIVLFISLVFLTVYIFSCSETPEKNVKTIRLDSIIYKPGTKEPLTGTWKGEADSMKVIFDVVNGKKEGKFESYYPNGKLLMSGTLKNNRNEGEWKYFFNNGIVESAGMFENDKPVGKWSWYYPDGTLRQTGFFNYGQRDSIWKTYDSTGVLIDSVVINSDTTNSDTSN